MSESPGENPTHDPHLVRTDANGRRHYRMPLQASSGGKNKRSVIAERSLAPFTVEPGSPWSRLISLLPEAVVDEIMKEAAQGPAAMATAGRVNQWRL
jgi:hypothetical protein